ncbi:SIMPL domain-containing protein [Halostella litorea]|uniref:SIMPL domain-containing protein n=1 Tax=Halostella litorea TaxID=2528831 RepID=UPI00109280A8|nr:SIMPL domain-containing protein [Halostella litorea]
MSRKIIATLAVATLLVTAGCLGAIGDSSADTPTTAADDGADTADRGHDDGRTVQVRANGEVTADPDRAILDVAVRATADDPETARERLSANVSTMRAALAEIGIEDDQVETGHYVIRQDRESRRNDDVTRYVAIHSFEVETDDVDGVGSVIETAVNNGATDVNQVQFTLSEEARSDLRADALTAAMENARADADVLAENANLSIAGVSAVSTGSVDVRPYHAEAMTAAADAGGTNVESGPVTVSAQVQVTYNATAA